MRHIFHMHPFLCKTLAMWKYSNSLPNVVLPITFENNHLWGKYFGEC